MQAQAETASMMLNPLPSELMAGGPYTGA